MKIFTQTSAGRFVCVCQCVVFLSCSEDATETKKPSTQLPNFAKDVLQVK